MWDNTPAKGKSFHIHYKLQGRDVNFDAGVGQSQFVTVPTGVAVEATAGFFTNEDAPLTGVDHIGKFAAAGVGYRADDDEHFSGIFVGRFFFIGHKSGVGVHFSFVAAIRKLSVGEVALPKAKSFDFNGFVGAIIQQNFLGLGPHSFVFLVIIGQVRKQQIFIALISSPILAYINDQTPDISACDILKCGLQEAGIIFVDLR